MQWIVNSAFMIGTKVTTMNPISCPNVGFTKSIAQRQRYEIRLPDTQIQ